MNNLSDVFIFQGRYIVPYVRLKTEFVHQNNARFMSRVKLQKVQYQTQAHHSFE